MNRFFVGVGAVAIVAGLGGLVWWQLGLASQRRIERSREAAQQQREAEEAARAAQRDEATLLERRAQLDAQLGKMARVPATTFAMGSDDHDNDERPISPVAVPAFEIDVREVSMISFAACVKMGACKPAGTGDACNATRAERAADPINCVDASQAEAFCAWAGKRLPREEEWELAARGAESRVYPWGPTPPTDDDACWKRADAAKALGTCKVGERGGPSPFGLVDVAGNVREWTASPYCPYSKRDCDAKARVVRGGSWSDVEGDALRGSVRAKLAPDARSPEVGFRCARDVRP